MIRSRHGFFKGVFVGAVAGLLIGSVTAGTAAMKKDGWFAREGQFRLGYLVGFLDTLRIAKASNPGGRLAEGYRIPAGAKPLDWLGATNAMYLEEERAGLNIMELLVHVGPELEKRFGGEADKSAGLAQLAEILAARREAIADGRIPTLTEEQIAYSEIVNKRNRMNSKCLRECRKPCRPKCEAVAEAKFGESQKKAEALSHESIRERDEAAAAKKAESEK